MQCVRCGEENPPQAKFCLECAASLVRRCAQCGAELPGKAKFCVECAAPVANASPAPTAPPAPQAYTPAHLAERILASKAALEGERKQVTVLFADLKGSMELLAERDPEEARQILDPVLHLMMEAVHRYEGTVNQVMGDGIMALFGAPIAHEDHALRACYAALAMQESVRRHNDELRRTQGLEVQVRVGLNSGEVVVRSIGSDLRMDYTAVGQTTHLAARMEQLANPGTVRLTGESLRLVEGLVQVRTLGAFPVKGLSEAIEVFELVGAAPNRSRLHAQAARGLTRFVGRQAELEVLRRVLESAGRGQGQVVAVVGEAGVGKSRLAWEFTHSHRTQGWLALEARSVSYGRATSYLPVIDLLKGYCRIDDRDDSRVVREKLTGKLLAQDEALRPLLTPLLWLLDVPLDDPTWQALEPPQRRQRALEAVRRLVLRECREQPLLLVFEDLHWIDAETQALLDSLVESLAGARVLLLVNYRPEYRHTWGSKTYYSQIRLDPLPSENAEELLDALLGPAPSLRPVKRLLIQRTEGTPFFLEEGVRTLVETGALAGERGAYRLAKAVETIRVPATVQALLAARIDRLEAEDKRLLQSAAVIGKDVPLALLQAVAEVPESELLRALARLQTAEFLYETSLYPSPEYTFRHALTHEVAYAGVLQERRRALHARIAEAMQTLYAGRLEEHVERLAEHAYRGEQWGSALDYLRQAGARAVSRSALREGVGYFERALEAAGHLPAGRAATELGIDLRTELRNALYPLGEMGRIAVYLREAEQLAEALGDPRRLGWLSINMSNYLWLTGENVRALELAQRALALAGQLGDTALEMESCYRLGLPNWSLGRFRDAIAALRRVTEAVGEAGARRRFGTLGFPSIVAWTWLSECHAELGEFPQAIAQGEMATRLSESVEHPFSLASSTQHLGAAYVLKGEYEPAIEVLERGLEVCREWDLRLLYPTSIAKLGHAYALAGRIAEGTALVEEGVERYGAMGTAIFRPLHLSHLGKMYHLAGRAEQALATAREALSAARAQHDQAGEARALHLLGEIAAEGDDLQADQAESCYRQALALAEELEMRPLVAHCHLSLGELYRRTSAGERAEAELEAAVELYRGMDMHRWLERAESQWVAVAGASGGAR